MHDSQPRNRTLLVAAVGAVLMLGFASQATAQLSRERDERRGQRDDADRADKATLEYPNATRESPKAKAGKAGRKLQKMVDLYDDGKSTEAAVIADEIIAAESSNAYEQASAAQFAAQIAYEADDYVKAMGFLNQALTLDTLKNENHFGAMWMLAQLQLQEEQYPDALATVDRLMVDIGEKRYDHLLFKGRVLNRMERYPEAIAALKEAQAAAPEGKNDWQGELMYAYAETDQGAEVAKLAEALAAQNPSDKRSQMNLAASYQQADMLEKAAEVMEKLRASGQLTEDAEYRQLYSTYLNLEGREKDAANVINDGLQKGVLKPDFQVYQALAQAYYFSEQVAPAIDAYKKAAPLDEDGETYLNLARLLWQEDRIDEAKEAAQQAIAKGVEKPDDAQKILAL